MSLAVFSGASELLISSLAASAPRRWRFLLCCRLYSLRDASASGELDEFSMDVASLGVTCLLASAGEPSLVALLPGGLRMNLFSLAAFDGDEIVDVELELWIRRSPELSLLLHAGRTLVIDLYSLSLSFL